MSHQTYTIYFDGKIAKNFNPVEVKKRAQTVFKLSEEKIHIFFNGSSHILKENLSQKECEQYLKQLLNIGLIANSTPPLITTKVESMSVEKTQNAIPSKYLLAVIALLIVGTITGWLLGFINFGKTSAPTDTTAVQTQATPPNLIEECTSEGVTTLLEKILIEGIPQLIQRSSPNIKIAIQDYSYNQEVYFDSQRNKRLCGVLSQYKIEGAEVQGDVQDPSIIYEVIYEIEKEEDQSIKLSTFRQRIVSSNLANTNSSNEQELEQD